MSQLILQLFRCFIYVTAHFPTLLLPLLRHRIFTYVIWRATHVLILTPVVNFGEVRRVLLAKSTLLTSTLVPLGSFQIFNVCSDAKGRVGCGKQREATASIQSLVKL